MDFIFKKSYCGSLKAVILDWTGTIVDFGCFSTVDALNKIFQQQRIELTTEEIRSAMGLPEKDHLQHLLGIERISKIWTEIHGAPCSDIEIETLYQSLLDWQSTALVDYMALVPELKTAVREFRQRGMKIGTTTQHHQNILGSLVEAIREQGFQPDSIVCRDDVPAGCPAPWMALQNAIQLHVYPMAAVLHIGDTVKDIEAGLNAGMWSVGVLVSGNEMGMTLTELQNSHRDEIALKRNRAKERLLQAGAHYVIDSLAEIPDLLEQLNTRLSSGEQP